MKRDDLRSKQLLPESERKAGCCAYCNAPVDLSRHDEFKGWVAVECRETQHESIKCRSIENLDVGPRETFRVPIADLPSNGVFAVWVGDGQPSGQLQYSVETKRPYPFQKSAPETSK